MRRLREQPRITLAAAAGLMCLVLVGIAIGTLIQSGDDDRARAAQTQLVSASHSLSAQRVERRAALARAERAELARARAEREVAALKRANRRLRRDLRAANRALHRRQRKQ